jgi:hypothetical protein
MHEASSWEMRRRRGRRRRGRRRRIELIMYLSM